MADNPKLIEVEGDKAKVDKTRARMEAELEQLFGSVIVLSVKVLRPTDRYPYERDVWKSEIRVPVKHGGEHVQAVVDAWVETMDAGIKLAQAFGSMAAPGEEAGDD